MLMEDGSQSFLPLRRQILWRMYHLTGDYAHEHYVNFFKVAEKARTRFGECLAVDCRILPDGIMGCVACLSFPHDRDDGAKAADIALEHAAVSLA